MRLINFPVFLISLAVGLFIVYISSPKFELIKVYPTPENEDKYLYQDKGGTCYRFKSKEINCPDDSSAIKSIPVQNGKPADGIPLTTAPGIHIT